jgi:hypothetical protein
MWQQQSLQTLLPKMSEQWLLLWSVYQQVSASIMLATMLPV